MPILSNLLVLYTYLLKLQNYVFVYKRTFQDNLSKITYIVHGVRIYLLKNETKFKYNYE